MRPIAGIDPGAILEFIPNLYRRYVYERPSLKFRELLALRVSDPRFHQQVEQFCKDGLLILPAYFSGEILRGMQADFEGWIQGKEEDSVGRKLLNEYEGSSLRESYSFSLAAVDPYLMSLVSYYWGKPIRLSASTGLRLDPVAWDKKIGPWQWHHDAKRKQVKAMIYLTDVTPDGQRMDYLPGTHKIWHRFRQTKLGYDQTRFRDEDIVRHGKPTRCTGPAGTVLLFDTNGLHRGNKNLSVRRDVWVFQYTAGRDLTPLSGLHPRVISQLSPEQKRLSPVLS